MRRRFSDARTLVRALALALTVLGACGGKGRDTDEDEGANTGDFDAGAARQDAARPLDGSAPDTALDAAPAAPPVLPAAQADACVPGPFPAPTDSCGTVDPTEPSSHAAPAILEVAPTCGVVQAGWLDNDQDAYRFVARKADPVLVELSYATSARTDLDFEVRNEAGMTVKDATEARKTAEEAQRAIFAANASTTYDVRIKGSNTSSCQRYGLRVNTQFCTDAYEDNDSDETAYKLAWNEQQAVEVQGTIFDGDSDFFEVVSVKADPILFAGSYSAPSGSSLLVRRTVHGPSADSVIDVSGKRQGESESESETFEHWLDADAPGIVFRARLWPSGSGCGSYRVKFDAAGCTDAFEDNDTLATAKPLPLGQTFTVTSIVADADYYDVSALTGGGVCTFDYVIPAGQTQQLRANIYNSAGSEIVSGLGGSTTAAGRSLTLTWGSERGVAKVLKVSSDFGKYCQPYTIRCSAPAPAAL